LRRELRDSVWRPERWLVDDPRLKVQALLAEKAQLASQFVPIANRHQRILAATQRRHRLRELNQALEVYVAPRREALQSELANTARQLEARQILVGREYAFCLYPKETLSNFLLAFRASGT
jgi:hypothetical protein